MASEASMDSSKVEGAGECDDSTADQARREAEERFNIQRARMKELFLQKEEDLQRLMLEKQQLESEVMGLHAELQQMQVLSANQQSELKNLQLIVAETVEASSSGSEEARLLRARNAELEHQITQLRAQIQHLQQQQQEVSLAPATFVRSLARKLTADTDVQDQPPRKNVEDGELAQSLIQPLEAEIFALKNKLRETDAQLQEALKSKSAVAASAGDTKTDEISRTCDMCANYEKQLVAEQAAADAARDKASKLDHALKLATEELEGVRSIHDETVRSWHSERAASSQQLEELKAAVEEAKTTLDLKVKEAEQASQHALEHVTTLTVDRETLQKKLDMLERDNAVLVGQFTQKAHEMHNEIIDLPDSTEALQELALRLREQLIACAVGRERALQDAAELRAQLLEQGALCHHHDAELARTRQQLRDAQDALARLQTERSQMGELGDKLRQSSDMIEKLLEDKKRLQTEVAELRSRVLVLQQELDNSEKVQQDFVRLSQSLQVQLQRIREADTEVRWQNDEDVSECPSCHVSLPNSKKKVHCRHCGRIFCAACVAHVVPAGPRRLPARVCTVCRTLLQPHTAPYFSTDPPHSPD
ncbi:rab GTPase-binding effector protein 1 isoform X1 [Hyposmocoma kahamanoa]|uniref:rab GTPase-binding effector protein 1 isoform X1 n=1 Tax=Hyposmocoma kahamanoa TaxID=1477025 RepID=UPI000E6D77A4|nr:rab GTPase-binding effector protein 1 isoform X1 [Hyposmocoma kahamanoa]